MMLVVLLRSVGSFAQIITWIVHNRECPVGVANSSEKGPGTHRLQILLVNHLGVKLVLL